MKSIPISALTFAAIPLLLCSCAFAAGPFEGKWISKSSAPGVQTFCLYILQNGNQLQGWHFAVGPFSAQQITDGDIHAYIEYQSVEGEIDGKVANLHIKSQLCGNVTATFGFEKKLESLPIDNLEQETLCWAGSPMESHLLRYALTKRLGTMSTKELLKFSRSINLCSPAFLIAQSVGSSRNIDLLATLPIETMSVWIDRQCVPSHLQNMLGDALFCKVEKMNRSELKEFSWKSRWIRNRSFKEKLYTEMEKRDVRPFSGCIMGDFRVPDPLEKHPHRLSADEYVHHFSSSRVKPCAQEVRVFKKNW